MDTLVPHHGFLSPVLYVHASVLALDCSAVSSLVLNSVMFGMGLAHHHQSSAFPKRHGLIWLECYVIFVLKIPGEGRSRQSAMT